MTNHNESIKDRVSHTPGPFWYERSRDECDDTFDISAPGIDRPMVSVPFRASEADWAARAEANARLFAAAPDLLSAAKLAHEWMSAVAGNLYATTEIRRLLCSAIAKAEEGEERR